MAGDDEDTKPVRIARRDPERDNERLRDHEIQRLRARVLELEAALETATDRISDLQTELAARAQGEKP